MSSSHQDVASRPPAPLVGAADRWRRRLERHRIRAHLRRAERALRRADHPDLTATERRRRRRHLGRLARYRRRGAFPHNRTVPERTPLFVGDDGTPCAMASLLLEDGREDLVERVMAEDPTAHIEDLPADHPVAGWLDENGLTRVEAGRVQPTYPEGVQFATTCGPLPCWLAGTLATTVGTALAEASEWIGYRLASDLFPENALKRRSLLAYVTVMNLLLAPLLALLLFALVP